MIATVKTFDQLTTTELYEILKARIAVFVVEQNCPYHETDDIDYRSLHIYYMQDGHISAYLRAFDKADEPGTIHVGRVLTTKRGVGLGGKLLKDALQVIRSREGVKKIYLEAQTYATGFYKREGFEIVSDEFLEDGIPHVQMELVL